MLTAKEWIVYILQNELEEEPIFKDGKPLGFLSVGEAAAKFDVGTATIQLWIKDYEFPAIKLGNEFFIPMTAERPSV